MNNKIISSNGLGAKITHDTVDKQIHDTMLQTMIEYQKKIIKTQYIPHAEKDVGIVMDTRLFHNCE